MFRARVHVPCHQVVRTSRYSYQGGVLSSSLHPDYSTGVGVGYYPAQKYVCWNWHCLADERVDDGCSDTASSCLVHPLPCPACLRTQCQHGDTRAARRVSPFFVFRQAAAAWLQRQRRQQRRARERAQNDRHTDNKAT
jgi:hypothetical protein